MASAEGLSPAPHTLLTQPSGLCWVVYRLARLRASSWLLRGWCGEGGETTQKQGRTEETGLGVAKDVPKQKELFGQLHVHTQPLGVTGVKEVRVRNSAWDLGSQLSGPN
jgi:hypothetical protein